MAQVKVIELDDDEQPVAVTMRLTMAEVLMIAKMTGRHSSVTANDIMRGGAIASEGLYEATTGGVINRFWDGGTDEAVSEL